MKKVLDCGTFAEPSRYLCSIFTMHMVLGGSLPTLLKNILDCGTSAEPSRYLYSIFTMHMVLGGSLSTLLNKILDCGTSAEPSRYLYSIFTMHMVLGGSLSTVLKKFWTVALLQSHQDTCTVSLLCTWFWEVSANPVEKYFGLWHFCRAIKILVQYLHYAHGFGGISANPVEKSFGLWHFCRAIKTLVQYLYYAQMARLSVGVYLIYLDDLGFWALLLLKKSFLPLN